MSRTILSVACPFTHVTPHAVGGAEQVISALDAAVTAAGDTSIVVAREGSQVEGRLYAVPVPQGELGDEARLWSYARCQTSMDRALAEHPVDLVHLHGMHFHQMTLPRHVPVLVTLHMPPSCYPDRMWNALPPNVHLQCVSNSQRQRFPEARRHLPVIPTGVAVPEEISTTRGDFALALGSASPEWNLHAALDAGTSAGVPVLLAGPSFPGHDYLAYFEAEIAPRLRDRSAGPRHAFLGALTPERKRFLLGTARCLLLPSAAPETCALAAMEALAAGTPVIALRSSAMIEIVTDGQTGFLVGSVDSHRMAEALRRVDGIDRELCRQTAAERFSLARMTSAYIDLYSSLMAGFRLRGRRLA